MAFGNAYNVYKSNSVNYASREQLLLMLLEGAVKFSKIAREGILEGDINKAHTNIIKTENIFMELMATLDINKGGEWTRDVYNIYDFIVQNLTKANLGKDINILDETIELIIQVKDMWNEAYKVSKSG